MQVTIRDILKAQGSLSNMVSKELPVVASFKLSRIVKTLNEELQAFNEKRNELISKYGEEVEGQTKVKEESVSDYTKDVEDLLDVSIDIKVDPITITELGNESKISAADFLQTDKFITA